MIYQVTLPHPALQPYVKEYLLCDFDFRGLAEIPTKLLPARAEQSIIFYPGEAFTKVNSALNKRMVMPHTLLQGQPLTVWHHYYPRTFSLVKVIFQPGGLFHLLGGAPMTEFTDAAIDAECVFGKEMSEVIQQLMNTVRYAEMLAVVDAYLRQKFARLRRRREPIDQLGRWLQADGPVASLDYLARQACLSFRQFERKFRERMGVSPKLFMRIARFNRAYALKEQAPARDWLDIALACGYADYQHMVKDFKQFAGVTPTLFVEAEARSPEHILLLR
ncbi:helix-turn-helix domain-containing protein [Hymenobacter sp. 5317J-9]|uniref:helix-turn-helix domain-containing protein n=1 Tax=Hymenobacter sp. 5317J-9 TaxID=2932250 RepID=UPI001FD6AF84|nr:helix-turn-helix domain-containing protein [Hymenobacter sp. 5317J-9]UOQ98956.1 helix-turn-helix domain-containing protein [Hymenobacter sp. 5317J-9]